MEKPFVSQRWTLNVNFFLQLFMGNINSTSEVSYSYFSPVVTRFVKFVPYSWHGHIAMRVELYGCDTGEF